jgi:hypothetical protein
VTDTTTLAKTDPTPDFTRSGQRFEDNYLTSIPVLAEAAVVAAQQAFAQPNVWIELCSFEDTARHAAGRYRTSQQEALRQWHVDKYPHQPGRIRVTTVTAFERDTFQSVVVVRCVYEAGKGY